MDFDTTGAFVDNALMVLCARHQPPLEETDELGDPIVGVMRDPQWILVAQSLQALLMHPKTETERLALRWIDPMHFNPAVCRHRAQYILWRQRKQLEERKQASTTNKKVAKVEVSDFNVLTSVSLKQEVDLLMADVRSKLPTVASGAASGDADSDDNEDDGEEIFRPPQHMLQSETDVAQAEAEAVLLQHVQEMQLEHYKRYHKWVETSYGTGGTTAGIAASHTASAGGGFSSSNNGTPSKVPAAGGGGVSGGRSGLVSQDEVQDIPLDKCSTQHVADLLEYLGISEHSHKFRRTTGRLLLQLKKEDMRERFGEDFEAADLLWSHIEENRVAVPSAAVMAAQRRAGGGSAAHTQVRKLYEDARAPNSALSNQSHNLSVFEQTSNPKSREQQEMKMQELLSKGDLSSIKRSMNPNRPARPSARQEVYDCSTSEDDYGSLGENYLRGVHGSTSEASTPEKNQRNNAGVSKSMSAGGGGYPNRPTGSSETESTTSSQSGAAAGMVAPRTAGGGNPAAARMGTTTSGPRGNDATYVDPAKKTQVNTAAPSRANRWAVVEYSDDDSDDN